MGGREGGEREGWWVGGREGGRDHEGRGMVGGTKQSSQFPWWPATLCSAHSLGVYEGDQVHGEVSNDPPGSAGCGHPLCHAHQLGGRD